MAGWNIGRFEYVFQRGHNKICIVEAEKEGMDQGMGQDLFRCEAVADCESMDPVYGIVTNYFEWIFVRSLDDRTELDNATLAVLYKKITSASRKWRDSS